MSGFTRLDNQWIFYNIKNFWLKLTHCENKSWKKLCPSFLNCISSTFFSTKYWVGYFPPSLLVQVFFFIQNCLAGFFFKITHPPPSKIKWPAPKQPNFNKIFDFVMFYLHIAPDLGFRFSLFKSKMMRELPNILYNS